MALPRLPLSMQRSVAGRAEHRAVKRRAIERAAQVMQFKRRAGAALLASISSPQQRGFPNGGTKLVSECGRHRRVSRARKVVITNGCGRYGVQLTACAVLANSRGSCALRGRHLHCCNQILAYLQTHPCRIGQMPAQVARRRWSISRLLSGRYRSSHAPKWVIHESGPTPPRSGPHGPHDPLLKRPISPRGS